jgi:hypothetical protein
MHGDVGTALSAGQPNGVAVHGGSSLKSSEVSMTATIHQFIPKANPERGLTYREDKLLRKAWIDSGKQMETLSGPDTSPSEVNPDMDGV